MISKRPVRRWLLTACIAGLLAAAGATGVFASTVPIPGDGAGEDTPFLPTGIPILHVHVDPHASAGSAAQLLPTI